jgi:hypothetical protein
VAIATSTASISPGQDRSESPIARLTRPGTTPGGLPYYSALATATALTMHAVFRLALRQTEGFIGSVIAVLWLALTVPDRSTMCRRSVRPN